MMTAGDTAKRPLGPTTVGRYVLFREIASGGMATVFLGRLAGPAGFARVVAIKRMHDLYAADPELVSMFIDEASLAARIQHPNVAATLDVVAKQKEIFIVMDYVHGEALATLLRSARKRRQPVPVGVASSILCGVLAGLHAAHSARGEGGEPLHIVHRDVSPQNILVGPEGLARVVDFGVAKAASRLEASGNVDGRGKLGYTAPERLQAEPLCDARADIFAVGVIAWEMLAGRRLFTGTEEKALLADVLHGPIPALPEMRKDVSPELWKVLARGLSRPHEERWETAEAFARAIEDAVPVATARTVGAWVLSLARETIEQREQFMREMEQAAKGKRTGSHADAMSVSALVEEIESKSGDQTISTRPPPAARDSSPSLHSDELPSTSGVRLGPSSSSPSVEEPIEIPGLGAPAPSRRKLGMALGGGALVLAVIGVVALRGAGTSAGTPDPSAAPSGRDGSAAASVTTRSTPAGATADPAPTLPIAPSAAPSASAAASASAIPSASAGSGGRPGTRPPGPVPGGQVPGGQTPGGKPGYLPDAP